MNLLAQPNALGDETDALGALAGAFAWSFSA